MRRECRDRFPRHHGLAIEICVTHVPWCISGSLTCGFLWNRWQGKRSRHSRRMHNPQFCVSGKRPIAKDLQLSVWWTRSQKRIWKFPLRNVCYFPQVDIVGGSYVLLQNQASNTHKTHHECWYVFFPNFKQAICIEFITYTAQHEHRQVHLTPHTENLVIYRWVSTGIT